MNWVNLLTLSSVLQGPGSQAAGTPTVAATTAATAATAVTTTVTGGAEPTITPLVVTPPPIATPVPAPPAANPLSGDFLTSVANPPLGPFSIGFLLLGLILLGAGIYFFFVDKQRWQRTNPLRYRATNTWGLFALILGGVSVLFVLLRVLGVPGLNIHLWLYLMLLVIIGFAAYGAYYFLVQYPKLAAASKRSSRGAVRATARTRPTAGGGAGTGSAPEAPAPKGSAGNPRGTSPRGDRRRTKR